MSILGRSGILALCAAVVLIGGLRTSRTAPTLSAAAVENSAGSARVIATEAEIVVSIGRFSLSRPEDTRALYSRLRVLADDFCFCASALRAVDYTTCRSAFERHVRLAPVVDS